ncbi:MAG TPA: hypothetical protein VHB02_11815 [Acidimicrobiales bacterium]|nr:hypothetical protein [Acidimicrobiales bacterium]
MGSDRAEELADRLAALADDLADLALDRLRTAADDPDRPEGVAAANEERRITRARRSVEKAVALLRGPD